MSTPNFPAPAGTFISIAAPARSRLFLQTHDDAQGSAGSLTQVATIGGSPESAQELAEALNRAAWTGDRRRLDALLANLPDPVVQSCERALDSCPDPAALAVGADGKPMTILRERTFWDDRSELEIHANAAMELGLQFLIENALDEDGDVEFTGKLLSDDCQVTPDKVGEWWASPQAALVERFQPGPSDLAASFSDSRWRTHVGRAYWMWIEDESEQRDDMTSAEAKWIFEFFDLRLGSGDDDQAFCADDDQDEEFRGYVTVRNRFILWRSLTNITSDLGALLPDMGESIVRDDMPLSVRDQPLAWWEKLLESAERLLEAARRGAVSDLEPRTVGEEALIALATRSDYVEWAHDSMTELGYQRAFDLLPPSPEDGEWGEILPDLTGDTDVEMLWQHRLDGIADPDDPTNRYLGIGDYRPRAWHVLFDRAKGK